MGGKGGVIAAAVLHMKDQRDIQYTRFQICILAVRPENMRIFSAVESSATGG